MRITKNNKKTAMIWITTILLTTMTSCTDINTDYRDSWVGVYSYQSDKDGGMTGDLYIKSEGDNCLSIYISGIGDVLLTDVDVNGNLCSVQQSWWCNDFSGRISSDSIHFEYTIKSVPNVRVHYDGTKISNTVPTSNFPSDYRDAWTGKYSYIKNDGGQCGTLELRKVSTDRLGLLFDSDCELWPFLFSVDYDGTITEIGNSNGFHSLASGTLTTDSLVFSYTTTTAGSSFTTWYYCNKKD